MSDCKVCTKTLKNVRAKIQCVDCKSFFHGKCVNVTPEDINYYVSENELWRCVPCAKTHRKSIIMESASTQVTYEDILQKFQEISDEFKRVENSLGSSIEACHEQVRENVHLSKESVGEITALKEKMSQLVEENAALRKKVGVLEAKIDDMEQYSRRNCFEIHGIPEVSNKETLSETLELVKKVGDAVGYPITENMVDTCHRLRKRQGDKPAAIIVKMVRRLDAEEVIRKRREKQQLSTRHLNLPSDHPVYVNESLSPARRRLLFHAREAKVAKGYKYLWIRGGKILLRKNDNASVKVIAQMSDIANL